LEPYWGKPDVRNLRGGGWKRDPWRNEEPTPQPKGRDWLLFALQVRAPVLHSTGEKIRVTLSRIPVPDEEMRITPPARGKREAGEAGRFSDLDARAVTGDQLTPHHMPQAAAKFTSRGEGGALALPHQEHVLTRTYGVRGRAIARAEAGVPFRQVLARDIRDVRRIAGGKYNKGLQELIAYYRENFPDFMDTSP
jgi:hypothetical protein